MLIHLIPFDKFILEQTLAIREANNNDIIIAVGSPSHSMHYTDVKRLYQLNGIIYVQKRTIIRSTFNVFRILKKHSHGAALVVHGMDLLYTKYICLFCMSARIDIYWHIRGTDLYRHLQDPKLPCLHRALNNIIYPHVQTYMSSTALDAYLVKSVFRNTNYVDMIVSPSNTISTTSYTTSTRNKSIRVLVGNSATWTSNIDLFLKLYDPVITENQDAEFVLQIAYGSEKVQNIIKDQVVSRHNITLNRKFRSLQEFYRYISTFEHAILMPSRMQGLGLLLSLISSEVTIHTPFFLPLANFLRQYQFRFRELNQSGTKLVSLTTEDHAHNRGIIQEKFSRQRLVHQWQQLANRITL